MRTTDQIIGTGAIFVLLILLLPVVARAADQEGCLNCHQYKGLARISADSKSVRDFHVDPAYYTRGLGPHARLKCTDCHTKSDVEVFPHKPATAVDCGRACHLDSAGNKVETRFSHDRVQHMLADSAHNKDVLTKSNELLGKPLRDGQAACLLCHDEPRFVNTKQSWAHQDAPVQRCNTCHGEELPQDTQFSYWHVTARSQPARSELDQIAVCGMCHSDRNIQKAFDLPDTTASYLASFHGKAVLLGNKDAAACIDCHVGPMQNVHVMQSKDKPNSPTHPTKLADTCRTPDCHATAGAMISTASVHLNLPTSRGVEFVIGCIFVLLIATTFGPSLLICVMKMVQIIIGRKDPHHAEHVHHAKALLANPIAREKLKRFNLHQRLQHWFLVVTFAALCLTGFPMKLADRAWAAWTIQKLGGLAVARNIHHWAGALLIAGFVYHMLYILRAIVVKRRKQGESWFKTVWNLPMMVHPKDGLYMLQVMLYNFGLLKKHPTAGRFNPEEKFEYVGVFWGTFVLGVTGVLMWANAWTTRTLPGRLLTIASLLHTFEAFLAVLHVGICHMVTVIFQPAAFPVSKAMFTGDTPADELVHGHSEMLDAVEAEVKAEMNHV